MPSSWHSWAMRVGPSRLISIADVNGESNDTVAAEWMTMSAVANVARSASFSPSPSVPTSPAMVVMRRSVIAWNDSPSGSPACRARNRSKASFLSSSFWVRVAAGVRLPWRTSRISSQSGTQRSRRSTSAVPDEPRGPRDGDALASE